MRFLQGSAVLFAILLSMDANSQADEKTTDASQPVARAKLIVGTKEVPPFSFRNRDGKWTGISIETWQHVAQDLKLGYEIRELTLDEILTGLEHKTIDVGVAAISVTADRNERVDFTHPHFTTGLGIAVSVDSHRSKWGGLKRIFTRRLLIVAGCLLSFVLALGLLFWIFESRAGAAGFGETRKEGMGLGIWWTVILLLGHKGVIPKTKVGRVMAASVMVVSILTFSVMTGVIASAMTVESLETPIQHPHDLRNVRTATVRGSTSAQYLTSRHIRFREFTTLVEALNAIDGGTIDAVVYDQALLKYTVYKQFADIADVLPVKFNTQEYAIALTRDSPWRKPINQSLLSYRASDEWDDMLFRFVGE
ncbi:MAG: transporter substrate-binding domain-containing protein [Planctomycetota bacterium]|nr:transporter substrate-binding domain-containing protein [Planctomycetota bacterium]